VEEATSAVVSVTFRRSRLAPLVTEVYISLVSHESLTERAQPIVMAPITARALAVSSGVSNPWRPVMKPPDRSNYLRCWLED
jgi:hypothetical protein